MRQFNDIGKGFLLLLSLIFFLSACAPDCRRWEIDVTDETCLPLYNSGRMSLATGPCDNLELELDRGSSGLRMYINVFAMALPHSQEDDQKTNVNVEILDETWTVLAERLQGGQRLLLPPEIADIIVDALLSNQLVNISVGRYHAEILSAGFKKHYDELLSIPIVEECSDF